MMCVNRFQLNTYFVLPGTLFLLAFAIRRYLFCGFVLGDDWEEFALIQHIASHGPDFSGHLQYRIGLWIFPYLFFKVWGVSESSFFLPTWILSSSLGVIGYFILWFRYRVALGAFWGGVFVATAPFEILLGTMHTNDLVFAWFLALGLFSFLYLEKRTLLQGIFLGILWWAAFYVKLWVVYLFPVLVSYYAFQIFKKNIWSGFLGFALTTLGCHLFTCLFWKYQVGTFFPFLTEYSATYSIEQGLLQRLFLEYPRMIFIGSEFGTTFFGYLPYLLVILIAVRLILLPVKGRLSAFPKLDRWDVSLLAYYGSFFLFLNFFPNSYQFDEYYSAPRIFRYLAPLSFPMVLHLAKMILDFAASNSAYRTWRKTSAWTALWLFLILLNIQQSHDATSLGRLNYRTLQSMVSDIRENATAKIVSEKYLAFFLKEVYFRRDKGISVVAPEWGIYGAEQHQDWLEDHQQSFSPDTFLITGLGSYIYYGAHYDGFRVNQFTQPLDPRWTQYGEYELLTYLPLPEKGKLWRWSESSTPR